MLPPARPVESRFGALIDIRINPPLDDALVAQLVAIWVDVSNAGGAVGFLPGVTPEQIAPIAGPAFERVRTGLDALVVAFVEGQPVGFGFLGTNDLVMHRHWATVKRLQRHPSVRAAGVGGALLDGLEQAARARGLESIVLTVRGGTGREGFYAEHGYRVDAVMPRRILLGDADYRDELYMSKRLTGPAGLMLQVQRLDPDLPLPSYAHPGDAGLDLYARTDVVLGPGERAVVPTGVAVALPAGCVGLVHPRSGLAARLGLSLVNSPGTIDEGYRGEVQVIAVNLDPAEAIALSRGDRIAQLVVQRVETVEIVEVDTLSDTSRGEGGFGSSGR